MENTNLTFESRSPFYSIDLQLQNIFLPDFSQRYDVVLENGNDSKAPMTDDRYINDHEYVVSVAQF